MLSHLVAALGEPMARDAVRASIRRYCALDFQETLETPQALETLSVRNLDWNWHTVLDFIAASKRLRDCGATEDISKLCELFAAVYADEDLPANTNLRYVSHITFRRFGVSVLQVRQTLNADPDLKVYISVESVATVMEALDSKRKQGVATQCAWILGGFAAVAGIWYALRR